MKLHLILYNLAGKFCLKILQATDCLNNELLRRELVDIDNYIDLEQSNHMTYIAAQLVIKKAFLPYAIRNY
jgi:hypothetical protein